MQQHLDSRPRVARHGGSIDRDELAGSVSPDDRSAFDTSAAITDSLESIDLVSHAHPGNPSYVPFSCETAQGALGQLVEELQAIRAARHRLDAEEAALFEWASRLAEAEAAKMPNGSERAIAHRAANAELGAAIQVSDRTVERHVAQAVSLVRDFHGVHDALAHGRIDRARAVAICEAGVIVRDEVKRARYAVQALEFAESESVNRVRPFVAQLAERFADRTIDERHREALEERRVTVAPLADGMALLQAVLSARDAKLVHARLTQCALECQLNGEAGANGGSGASDASDSRTMDQRRADALVDVVTHTDPGDAPANAEPPFRAKVQVTVPVSTLLRARGERSAAGSLENADAAMLAGHGVIDNESAHWFAAITEHWDILAIDESNGNVLEVDRYRPSERMRRRLAARDQHCRFPGCRIPAVACDLDHTIDAALGGPTATDNLAHLCRWHHTLKHHSPWRVEQRPGGDLDWTSPTGRTYRDRPASRVRFRWTGESAEPHRPDRGAERARGPGGDPRHPF